MRDQKFITWLASVVVSVLLGVGVIAGVFLPARQAQAVLPVAETIDYQMWIKFFQTEAQEITVDQIRKIVIEQITKKMIDKVVGGDGQGGTDSSYFINNYSQYLYQENQKDTQEYIDEEFDRILPRYINPALKNTIKDRYDSDYNPVPDDCINIDEIPRDGSIDSSRKLDKYLQYGCNELTAYQIIEERSRNYYYRLVDATVTEAISNQGFSNKDEDTNKLKQSGSTYQGIIQGALQSVYDVQTSNESALSSIIGAFLDMILDEILDTEY